MKGLEETSLSLVPTAEFIVLNCRQTDVWSV